MNFVVIDTETTNGMDYPLCYDLGWAIINEDGDVIKTHSFVNADIFIDEPQLMAEAFFADKIPQYLDDIANGTRELRHFATIASVFRAECKKYDVQGIIAHNLPFDRLSTCTTSRWLSKSKYRWFFPYGIKQIDTLAMSRQMFSKDANYKAFCLENGYCYGKNNNIPRYTAEVVYRYLTKNTNFIESHTGLEDVLIEKDIFIHCLKNGVEI